MNFTRKYYIDKLINSRANRRVKVITGLRRVGKSYLLNNLFYDYLISDAGVDPRHIIKISLDDLSMVKYRNPLHLSRYLNERITSGEFYYVFIDEIQFVQRIKNPYLEKAYIGFYEVLNELLNKGNVDIYVTGSNSKMLSKDVLTEFRGRGEQIHVMPLSLFEISEQISEPFEKLYADYQTYGGLPYIFTLKSNTEKETYLKALMSETYLIDVIERNKIKKTNEIDKLTNVIASSIGSFTNPTKIEKTFKSELNIKYNKETIGKHLDYLKEAFIINEVSRFDVKGRKYIGANAKYYYTDVGVRNAQLNFRQYEPTHLMENIIYNHLLMFGYSVDVGIVEINERSGQGYKRKQLEVDFVVNKGNYKYYIQAAYSIETKAKRDQEKRSLLNIADSYKKIIIVNDNFNAHYDEHGFLLVSLKEFLLEKDILMRY